MDLLQASIWRLINSSPQLLIVSPSYSHGLSSLTPGEEGFEISRVQNLYPFVRNGLEIVYVMLRLKNRRACEREKREHSTRSEKKAACTLIFSCYN